MTIPKRNAQHQRAYRQRRKQERKEFIEALTDATAHLMGATSAYKDFAGNFKRPGKRDALYSTRLKDFEKACDRARAALLKVKGGTDDG